MNHHLIYICDICEFNKLKSKRVLIVVVQLLSRSVLTPGQSLTECVRITLFDPLQQCQRHRESDPAGVRSYPESADSNGPNRRTDIGFRKRVLGQ